MFAKAYYNEIEPFAVAGLRELIKAGAIADGEVDSRSIAEVEAKDLRGFTQCHFSPASEFGATPSASQDGPMNESAGQDRARVNRSVCGW